MKKLMMIIMFVLMSTSVLATCTVTFDKAEYNPTETIEATMVCSSPSEKSEPFTLTWTNSTGGELEIDTGTTPEIEGTPFFETYQIPSTLINDSVTATLTGPGLEGSDTATTTDIIGNSLVIKNCQFKPKAFIGSDFSVDCFVYDVNDKTIDNAHCVVYATNQDAAPLQISEFTSQSLNGEFVSSGVLKPENMDEDTSYLAEIRCHCETGDNKCWNSEGSDIEKYQGGTAISFTTAKWLSVNAFTRRTEFEARQVLTVCANVTTVDATERVNTENYYKVWCGQNFTSNDRVVIASTPTLEPDRRGLNPNQTVNHCWALVIPEKRWMQGRTNNCLASTEVWVLNNNGDRIKLYSDRSESFNITISDIGINADWLISGSNNHIANTRVNMSSDAFNDWMPDETAGNIDLRLDLNQPEYVDAYTDSVKDGMINFQNFYDVQNIASCSMSYCNGTSIECRLEVTNDGFIEIEAPVDNQATACIDATVIFHTYSSTVDKIYSALIEWLGWMIMR